MNAALMPAAIEITSDAGGKRPADRLQRRRHLLRLDAQQHRPRLRAAAALSSVVRTPSSRSNSARSGDTSAAMIWSARNSPLRITPRAIASAMFPAPTMPNS